MPTRGASKVLVKVGDILKDYVTVFKEGAWPVLVDKEVEREIDGDHTKYTYSLKALGDEMDLAWERHKTDILGYFWLAGRIAGERARDEHVSHVKLAHFQAGIMIAEAYAERMKKCLSRGFRSEDNPRIMWIFCKTPPSPLNPLSS